MLLIKATYSSVHFLQVMYICSHIVLSPGGSLTRESLKFISRKRKSTQKKHKPTTQQNQNKQKNHQKPQQYVEEEKILPLQFGFFPICSLLQNTQLLIKIMKASVLRGSHLNKQVNFHFKYMFCHASTKQKSVISHLMQMLRYPGAFAPPEKRKTISACSLLSTGSFLVQPEV